jgi:hypothetical protein
MLFGSKVMVPGTGIFQIVSGKVGSRDAAATAMRNVANRKAQRR